MSMDFAFFDTCSRFPVPATGGFRFAGPFDNCARAPDAEGGRAIDLSAFHAVRSRINALHAIADRLEAPILSTICLKMQRQSGGPPLPELMEQLGQAGAASSFASMSASAPASNHRHIVVERLSCSNGADNTRLRTFDPFSINPNTAAIANRLGPRRWILFGTGTEVCLEAIALGLRKLGNPVLVMEDASILALRAQDPALLRASLTEAGAAIVQSAQLFPVCDERAPVP